jgi:hypothetical protein
MKEMRNERVHGMACITGTERCLPKLIHLPSALLLACGRDLALIKLADLLRRRRLFRILVISDLDESRKP